eukprot:1196209-Prorocentrum_minimum.AAC.13
MVDNLFRRKFTSKISDNTLASFHALWVFSWGSMSTAFARRATTAAVTTYKDARAVQPTQTTNIIVEMAFHSSRIDVTGAQVSGMTIVQYLELFKCSQFTESGVRTERSKRSARNRFHAGFFL